MKFLLLGSSKFFFYGSEKVVSHFCSSPITDFLRLTTESYLTILKGQLTLLCLETMENEVIFFHFLYNRNSLCFPSNHWVKCMIYVVMCVHINISRSHLSCPEKGVKEILDGPSVLTNWLEAGKQANYTKEIMILCFYIVLFRHDFIIYQNILLSIGSKGFLHFIEA